MLDCSAVMDMPASGERLIGSSMAVCRLRGMVRGEQQAPRTVLRWPVPAKLLPLSHPSVRCSAILMCYLHGLKFKEGGMLHVHLDCLHTFILSVLGYHPDLKLRQN